MLYAFFDGDDVGPTLERLLTENRIQEARGFSLKVTNAMKHINRMLKDRLDVEIIFSGGDDLLIKVNPDDEITALVGKICESFRSRTGNTMSCGVASDIRKSIWNLHLAKLFGKDQIRGLDGDV
jgi:CRISPR/Cas system-associated protein Cas10 (large subunit of type III CRISPR-Cas system)